MVDEARAWWAALPGVLRGSACLPSVNRAGNPLENRAPHHPPASFRFAPPCRVAPGLAAAAWAVPLRPYRGPKIVAADALGRFDARRGRKAACSHSLHARFRLFGL